MTHASNLMAAITIPVPEKWVPFILGGIALVLVASIVWDIGKRISRIGKKPPSPEPYPSNTRQKQAHIRAAAADQTPGLPYGISNPAGAPTDTPEGVADSASTEGVGPERPMTHRKSADPKLMDAADLVRRGGEVPAQTSGGSGPPAIILAVGAPTLVGMVLGLIVGAFLHNPLTFAVAGIVIGGIVGTLRVRGRRQRNA